MAVKAILRRTRYAILRVIGVVGRAFGVRRGPLCGVEGIQKWRPSWTAAGELPGEPDLSVREIEGGTVFSDYGVVISPERRLVADVSPTLAGPIQGHAALDLSGFPIPHELDGRVAVISSHAHQRYYHWMFDILPRLGILASAAATIDKLVVNRGIAYQAETLRLLNVPEGLIVDPISGGAISAERLVVPSLPGIIGEPTLRSIRYLRDAFSGWLAKGPPLRRLYVSRSDAGTRRVTNEAEVCGLLQEYGFETVTLEGRSVVDQVRLFSEAEIVVGSHGAGMTNIVFMSQASGGLIEFMPTTYEHSGFEIICRKLQLPYCRLISASSGAPSHDVRVEIEAVRAEIERRLADRGS